MANISNKSTLIKLDFGTMADDSTRVTFQHQCFKLTLDEGNKENYTIRNLNEPRKRRQLSKMPERIRPLEKIWKKENDHNNVDKCQPLSIEIRNGNRHNVNDLSHRKVLNENHRWTPKLSTDMTLEIDNDPINGQTISLKMFNLKNENEKAEIHSTMPEWNDYIEEDTINSAHPSAYNDSGISSNLQSPTVSNSESIDYPVSSSQRNKVVQLPEATHRVLYRFCARHTDEIDLEIGDAVHVFKEFKDQWSDGLNLRTKVRGIFPSSLVADVDFDDFNIESNNLLIDTDSIVDDNVKLTEMNITIKRERYVLDFLGSVEVCSGKGDQVLDEAINRVKPSNRPNNSGMEIPYKCILEVSDIGVRMMSNKTTVNNQQTKMANNSSQHHDYFFSLVQLTYCGYQLKKDKHFFAFITRHPSGQSRYACHVFQTPESRQDITETVGQAFHRFYNRFVAITIPFDKVYL